MKKLTTIAMAIALGCTLAACSKNQDNAGSGSGSSSTSSSSGTGSGSTASSTPTPPPASTTAATPAPSSTDTTASTSSGSPATTTPGADASASSGPGASGTNVAGAGASGGNGQAVFQQTCVACHGAGVAGAPKVGDKARLGPSHRAGQGHLVPACLAGLHGQEGRDAAEGRQHGARRCGCEVRRRLHGCAGEIAHLRNHGASTKIRCKYACCICAEERARGPRKSARSPYFDTLAIGRTA